MFLSPLQATKNCISKQHAEKRRQMDNLWNYFWDPVLGKEYAMSRKELAQKASVASSCLGGKLNFHLALYCEISQLLTWQDHIAASRHTNYNQLGYCTILHSYASLPQRVEKPQLFWSTYSKGRRFTLFYHPVSSVVFHIEPSRSLMLNMVSDLYQWFNWCRSKKPHWAWEVREPLAQI